MSILEDFLAEDHSDKTEYKFLYEYSCIDDTFADIESEGHNVINTDLALLPAQIEFMNDTESRTLGYVGGFGSGVWWGFFY